MTDFSRRDVLKYARGTFAAVAAASRIDANPLGLPLGCQTWPVREMISKDYRATFKQLSAAGFRTVELCSPVGYASSGFASLTSLKGAELKRILSDEGLQCHSSHFGMDELRKDLPGRIAWASDVGLTQMLVPSLEGPKNPSMDDVKRAAEEYNKIAAQSAKAGIQQGLHNEDFELTTVDGKRTYDLLFGLLDPKLVKMQFQVSIIADGYDPVAYFNKYPGRFISMHVQDLAPDKKTMVPVGKGIVEWKKVFAAAKKGGIKNYFVEMDLDLMKASVPYLRQLKV